MSVVTVQCAWCNRDKTIPLSEYNRRIKQGHTEFFCNNQCGAYFVNSKKDKLRREIVKQCSVCGNTFTTISGKDERKCCSSTCAHRRPMTGERLSWSRKGAQRCHELHPNVLNIEATASALKKREAWKYKELKEYLESKDIDYEFECPIEDRIFDLVLPEHGVIVEFDGKEHGIAQQQLVDQHKNRVAESNNYRIMRIPVSSNSAISVDDAFPNGIPTIDEIYATYDKCDSSTS